MVSNNNSNNGEFEYRADIHQRILQQIHATYRAKNRDYGGSFTDLYKQYGIISPIIKLEDKMSRLRSLSKNPENRQVLSESIEDTLLDLANYAIMTIMELRINAPDAVAFDYFNFDYDSLPKIVAVDFDGTLVQGACFPEIGERNERLIKQLTSGKYKDYKKILLTNRCGRTLQAALDFIESEIPELHFDAINDNVKEVKDACGGPYPKVWYSLLIDDKVLNVNDLEPVSIQNTDSINGEDLSECE